jgi:hypothetical protein
MVACGGEAAGDFDVFGGELEVGGAFVFGERADDAAGGSDDEGAFGDDHAFGHEGTRSDDAARADVTAIEEDGTHADEDFIFHPASMHDGAVADGDVVANDGGVVVTDMDDSAVLNVAAGADMDGVDIATKNSAIPDAGLGVKGHITDDHGTLSDEYLASYGGGFLWKQEIN